jgi:N-acetylmuramoyl-L-alanine amidase
MIAPLGVLLAVLLQGAAPAAAGESLRVRAGDREATIALVETNAGPAVPVALLAPVTSVAIAADSVGGVVLRLAGVEMRLSDQVPFVRIGDTVLPLAAAPFSDREGLHVPLQLLAELLPRYGAGVTFDAARAELRLPAAAEPTAASMADAFRAPPSAPPMAKPAVGGGARATSTAAVPAVSSAPPPRPATRGAATPRRHRRTIVVDAGHGGTDPGMRGPYGRKRQVREKDITLAVSRLLRVELQRRGYDVVMTRTKDTLIALSDRGKIANRAEGDLFLSIHVNAANPRWRNPGAARGFETYFLAEAKTEDAKRVEQMENEAVRFETGADAPTDDPLSFIIADMAQNEHLRESSELATFIQQRLGGVHPGPNRGVKQAGFRVLVTAYMPAVLVELGFGTNAAEVDFLASLAGQRKLADAIADATVEYLEHYEKRIQANATP